MKNLLFLILFLFSFPLWAVTELSDINVTATENSNNETAQTPLLQSEIFLPAAPMQKQIRTKDALEIAGSNGDPLKSIQTFAGVVSTSNDSSGDIYIHGSKPRETLFNINHLRLGYIFHFGGLYSVIAPEAVDQIDAYLGGFDTTYEAMGAVVDITPKYPTGSNKGRIHIGMYDSDFAYDMKLGENTSLFVSARRSYFDLFADAILDGKLFEDDNDKTKKVTYTLFPQFYDMNFILAHKMENQDFALEFIRANDKLKINTNINKNKDPIATGKVETDTAFTTIGLRWNYYDDIYSAMTLLSYLDTDVDLDLFSANYYVNLNPQIITLYHQSVWSFDLHTPTIGFEINRNRTPIDAYATGKPTGNDFEELVTDQTPVRLNSVFVGVQYTFFAQDIWNITPTNHFRYGARVWKTDFQDFTSGIDLRLAWVHDFDDTLTLSFAVGKYSQFPENSYLVEGFGNPKINTSEFSIHYAFNVTKTFENASQLIVEPYFKSFDNLVIDDAFEKYKAIGEGKASGVDVTYVANFQSIDMTLAYTYIKTRRQLFTNDTTQYRFQGDIPHTFQLSTKYRFSNQWRISSLLRLNSGTPYTPIIATEDFEYQGKTYKRPIYGAYYSQRLPALFDWDIQFGKTYYHKTNSIEYSIELMNFSSLFKKSIQAYTYDDNYKRDGEVTGLGFLPALHITYRF